MNAYERMLRQFRPTEPRGPAKPRRTIVQFRQGDVLIERIDNLPQEAKLAAVPRDNGRIVLAYGEVTGHAHAITQSKAVMFMDTGSLPGGADALGSRRFLDIKEETVLAHEEHAPITLPPGLYEVIRQREFDPAQERYVED